jgi:chemotaxis protein methyltransferase CheR
MNRAAFDYFADLLRRESGMQMTPEKYYLLETRLHPIVQQQGVVGIDGLASLLRRDEGNNAVRQAVVEAMATHETSFFRDTTPFDRLRDTVLPVMAETRAAAQSLRIWCAACASGQEAYSIALLLREYGAPFSGWKIDITGTDMAHGVIEKAQSGAYSQFEVQRGMPARLLVKYFTQEGDVWRLREDVRAMTRFRQANLLQPPPLPVGSADIVFCRNVLMYLDASSRVRVLQGLHAVMHAGSVLFLGAAETAGGLGEMFCPVAGMPGLYVRGDSSLDLPRSPA